MADLALQLKQLKLPRSNLYLKRFIRVACPSPTVPLPQPHNSCIPEWIQWKYPRPVGISFLLKFFIMIIHLGRVVWEWWIYLIITEIEMHSFAAAFEILQFMKFKMQISQRHLNEGGSGYPTMNGFELNWPSISEATSTLSVVHFLWYLLLI